MTKAETPTFSKPAQPHAMDPPPSMPVHRKSIRSEFTLNSTLQIECDDDKILQQFNAVREYSPNYGEPAKTVTIGDFLEMDIIGQWNKSFIVTRLDGSISAIDQHAACEAQNFEKLRNKKKKPQKLIQPVKLAVSPDVYIYNPLLLLLYINLHPTLCRSTSIATHLVYNSCMRRSLR